MLEWNERELTLRWPDGFEATFHPLWLRERSNEEGNKDRATGHRLEVAAFLPLDLDLTSAAVRDNAVELAFGDGHACRYTLDDLRSAATTGRGETAAETRLWNRKLSPLPWHDLADMKHDAAALLTLLGDLDALGFALVRGLPVEPDGLLAFTNLLGHIRETNWGRIADVKSVPEPDDLSMTPMALEPHVDNPYRVPQPAYVLLHCLENSAVGGDSILIDGFNVAERLRRDDPAAFRALAETPIFFRYADDDTILENICTFIEVGTDGRVRQTRFHGRSDQVLALGPATLERFYGARRALADIIWSSTMQLRLKLAPGEMYIVDNFRIFHGRDSFTLTSGSRHMRQCYMDRDVIASRQKVLQRSASRAG